jgi:hypothetical protein
VEFSHCCVRDSRLSRTDFPDGGLPSVSLAHAAPPTGTDLAPASRSGRPVCQVPAARLERPLTPSRTAAHPTKALLPRTKRLLYYIAHSDSLQRCHDTLPHVDSLAVASPSAEIDSLNRGNVFSKRTRGSPFGVYRP